jgi:CBS domain-containing protein
MSYVFVIKMVKELNVGEIMVKDVATISQDEKVTSAAMLMAEKNIGSVLIVDQEDPIGILTEKDLLKKVVALGKDPKNLFVRDVMTTSIISVKPNTSIFDAHGIMHEKKFRRLPVVDHNKLLGIVTETDLSKAMRDYGTLIKPCTESDTLKEISEPLHHFELKDAHSYVVVEENQNKIYDAFVGKVLEGYAGLAILRISPEKLKKKYGLKKTYMVWLTEVQGENCIKPTELEKLLFTISSFISKAEKSVILLDGLEYIESYTSFKEVFHILQNLVDKVSLSKSILLISMDKGTFDEKEFHLLERGLKVIEK